jgi:hypothetical protein
VNEKAAADGYLPIADYASSGRSRKSPIAIRLLPFKRAADDQVHRRTWPTHTIALVAQPAITEAGPALGSETFVVMK